MQGIKLKFKSVEQMVNNHAIGLVVLTDELETRQLNIVCDEVSMFQLNLRSRYKEQIEEAESAEGNGKLFSTTYLLP